MKPEKQEQVQLLIWLLIIVGPAMAIPGALVFGIVEYTCAYAVASALLMASVIMFGNAFQISQRVEQRWDPRHMTEWD